MARLTDVDVMIEYLRKQLCDNCSEETKEKWCDICDYAYLIDEMKKVPTVDAVGVVRCKDCVYCKRFNDVWYLPKRDELLCTLYVEKYHTTENDYCSRGERK